MKLKNSIFLFALLFGFMVGHAQTMVKTDARIQPLVSAVSADSLRSHIEHLVSFGTRHTMSDMPNGKMGISAARNWVLQKFKSFASNAGGRMTCYLQETELKPDGKRIGKNTNFANVVAFLKGTDPNDERVFIIGGHIDSRVSDVMNYKDDAPGANDDGSGTAGVIEAARVLSKSNFPASVVFVAFSGEEQGLFGAELLAQKAKSEHWEVAAVLNNDMIGNNQSNETHIINNTQVRVFSSGLPFYGLDVAKAAKIRNLGLENDGDARQLARYVKEIGERYVPHLEVKMVYRNDRFLRGGDHTPFVQQGFTAVRITEMNENYDHQHQDLRTENGVEYGDLMKFMDFEYFRKNVMLNVACLANLASAPGKPQQVKMEVKKLTNFTELSWNPPVQGAVDGYYVLVRETDQSMWQKKIFTTQTQIQLPYSKDNYLFAVQSVSVGGNESLPVVPEF